MSYIKTNKQFGCIYAITCTKNNIVYIGQTVNYLSRVQYHKSKLKRNCHDNPYLQQDYNMYGLNNFIFAVIEDNVPSNKLLVREDYWINYYGGIESDRNYNQENSKTLSKITRLKISNSCSGSLNGHYGKPHTEATKQSISAANKGNIRTKQTIDKWRSTMNLNDRFNNRYVSDNIKRKISEAQIKRFSIDYNKQVDIYNMYLESDNISQVKAAFPNISTKRISSIIKKLAGDSYASILSSKRISGGKRANPGRPVTEATKEKIRHTIQANGGRCGKNNGHYGKRKYSNEVVSVLRAEFNQYNDYSKIALLHPEIPKYAIKNLIVYGTPYKAKNK